MPLWSGNVDSSQVEYAGNFPSPAQVQISRCTCMSCEMGMAPIEEIRLALEGIQKTRQQAAHKRILDA